MNLFKQILCICLMVSVHTTLRPSRASNDSIHVEANRVAYRQALEQQRQTRARPNLKISPDCDHHDEGGQKPLPISSPIPVHSPSKLLPVIRRSIAISHRSCSQPSPADPVSPVEYDDESKSYQPHQFNRSPVFYRNQAVHNIPSMQLSPESNHMSSSQQSLSLSSLDSSSIGQ